MSTVTSPAAGGTRPGGRRRVRRYVLLAVCLLLLLAGVGAGALYVDSVPTPAQLTLPQATTIYYADGRTVLARIGSQNRTILTYDQMNEAVKQAIVAAEDRTFWTNPGIDFKGIVRAAWNNVSGGSTQGASTITQQYARLAAGLSGITYSRKLREAVMAAKLDRRYSKQQILAFYLNTVPFGRGAYGIEAAAHAFFGKTARADAPPAQQITLPEAMVLAAMVKQPEADPADPQGHPGYDPARGPVAAANSRARFEYIRRGLVTAHLLTQAQADALVYPDTLIPPAADNAASDLSGPIGLVVARILAELRGRAPFTGLPADYVRDGGFQITSTIVKPVQDAAVAAANIRGAAAPAVVRGQPKNWQAALVAVEPGTGRVLAYYGGNDGLGADYAGWHTDSAGRATGYGAHPPGSSFKVYDLAEALRQGMSMTDHFPSPVVGEFPAQGRTTGSALGPIRNADTAACQPDCTLWQATVASLNTTFFGLTAKLGVPNVIDMATRAGIDDMWTPRGGTPTRIRLRGATGAQVAPDFSTEVGIGQYPVTVEDHANGMATFAAGGERADAHFVRSVSRLGRQIYAEDTHTTGVGLNKEQINQLDWALSKVTAANLPNGWDSAGKTGTWQAGNSTTANAHAWMVGYTRALAAAVWLGTTDGKPLVTRYGSTEVYGANYPGPIWRQFMVAALAALRLNPDRYRFAAPAFPGPSGSPLPPGSGVGPSGSGGPAPTCPQSGCPSPTPTGSPTPTRSPTPGPSPKPSPSPSRSTRVATAVPSG